MVSDIERRVGIGRKLIERWLTVVFGLVLVFILVLLPAHAFLSTWLGTTIGPLLVWKSWKEILLLAIFPLVIVYFLLRPDIFSILWHRRINQIILLYVILHIVLSLFAKVSKGAVMAGLLINLRFLAMFVLAQIISESQQPWVERVKKALPSWLLWTALGLSLLSIAQITIIPKNFLSNFGYNKDTTIAPYIVVDQNPNALRAFATMRGPNTLGAYLLLPLLLALWLLIKRRQIWLSSAALVLGVITLFATGSRSAWLGFALGVVVILVGLLPRASLRKLRWPALGALLAIVAVVFLATKNPTLRLAVFHSRADRASLLAGSSEKHASAIVDNALDALRHPLGQGPGVAGPASFYNQAGAKISENYFVQIAQEVGLLGLALFVVINFLVAQNLYRNRSGPMPAALFASFVGLSLINIFLHGWADDPTAMTWWGIAGLYFANQKEGHNEHPDAPHKKTA